MDKIKSEDEIPTLRLPKESEGDEVGSLGGKVREACEKYGCFVLEDDEVIPERVREQVFESTKALFDLPEETKKRHSSSKPYRSYAGNCPVIPLSESFGLDNPSTSDSVTAFTRLMWPHGNPLFWFDFFYVSFDRKYYTFN